MLLTPRERHLEVLRAAGGLTAIYVTPEGVIERVDA
jgi:hypothetical protein